MMRISILIKTFLTLLISFSLLFFFGLFFFYKSFSPKYVENNIQAVKEAVMISAPLINSGEDLSDTPIQNLSSETTFIRIKDNIVLEKIGPEEMTDLQIIDHVIRIYDSDDIITDGDLTYYSTQIDDIYQISYLYKFGYNDYMLIITRIQSLRNVDMVMTELGASSAIFLFLTIAAISILISLNIARPIKKINKYARRISSLDFSTELRLNRKDEFQDLISSLNEMTFNLQKSYADLNEANSRLSKDIEFEKNQETKKKALIMTINHELKTPVSVIKGMVEGMIDGVGRYKNKEKYLQEVLHQLESIESITKDLTYSLKLDDLAKQDDECNADSLSKNLSGLEEYASLQHVKIDIDILSQVIPLSEELYLILVSNLIKNAITYTTEKKIFVDTSMSNGVYVFTVKNSGEIPAKDIERIFEPYYRINQIADSTKGTGLGLFIVKQICEIYGCRYKIFNDNGYVVAKIEILLKI